MLLKINKQNNKKILNILDKFKFIIDNNIKAQNNKYDNNLENTHKYIKHKINIFRLEGWSSGLRL